MRRKGSSILRRLCHPTSPQGSQLQSAAAPIVMLQSACSKSAQRFPVYTPPFRVTSQFHCQSIYVQHVATSSLYTLLMFGCFPATPARAEVWYDKQLLMFTLACQMSGPTAIQAHCSALQELHMLNGCGPGKSNIRQHIANASQEWRRMQVGLLTLHCVEQYHAHPDRKLVCFFLDIACQFKGY